jgi:hypothetical protein
LRAKTDSFKQTASTQQSVHKSGDIAARADANEGIRQGLEEARSGKGRPVREFFAEFRAKAWQHFLIQERA